MGVSCEETSIFLIFLLASSVATDTHFHPDKSLSPASANNTSALYPQFYSVKFCDYAC